MTGAGRGAEGGVRVREARPGELAAVMNVLDGAALAVEVDRVRAGIGRGETLVAVAGEERVLGALLRAGEEITAVAVRPGRRGQGIGTALVEAAAEDCPRLLAEFDPGVGPFWRSLGFEISRAGDRCRGVRR